MLCTPCDFRHETRGAFSGSHLNVPRTGETTRVPTSGCHSRGVPLAVPHTGRADRKEAAPAADEAQRPEPARPAALSSWGCAPGRRLCSSERRLPRCDAAGALLPACLHGWTDSCPRTDANMAERLPCSIVPRSILMTAPGPAAPPDHTSQPPRNKMHQILDIFRSGMAAPRAPEAYRTVWASMDRETQ